MTTVRAASTGAAILGLVAAGLAIGCRLHPAGVVPDTAGSRILITEAMIARSGGQTAWEVLRREVPQFAYRENRSGQATGMERRGPSSFLLNDAPMLIVDGARNVDFRSLQQIPASTLFSIEVLTGIEGTTYYGTDAVGGVILIRTKSGTTP
jgi:outer membrane cobalamin receptor